MGRRRVDITGLRVGYLTAIAFHASTPKGVMWVVRCDCGREVLMEPSELKKQSKKGIQASCGCKRRETIGRRNTKHGQSAHPLYAVWRSMLDRCSLPTHHAWRNYGGRGITVCERWKSFPDFFADVSPTYAPGLTLDRENNEGNYEPSNCRWATRAQQTSNMRSNVWINTPKGRMTVSQAARAFGLGHTTILYRIGAGWPEDQLVTPPAQ